MSKKMTKSEMATEMEHLIADNENLRLYLRYVIERKPYLLSRMMDEFDGMPGYFEKKKGEVVTDG